MDLIGFEPVDRVGPVDLRNQELGRVQKKSVIDAEFTADRYLKPKPEADRVGPHGAKIVSEHIARSRRRRSPKNILRALKDIAPVIKGNGPNRVRQWYASLDVDDRKTVPAERNGKRVEKLRIAVAVAEYAFGYNNGARARRFESESAQGICSTRKEPLADRQYSLESRKFRW